MAPANDSPRRTIHRFQMAKLAFEVSPQSLPISPWAVCHITGPPGACAGRGHLLKPGAWRAWPAQEMTNAIDPKVTLRYVASPPPRAADVAVPWSSTSSASEIKANELGSSEGDTAKTNAKTTKRSLIPPDGRMALAGPKTSHGSEGMPSSSPPLTRPNSGPANNSLVLQPERFGPSIFKRIDALGTH